MVKNSKPINTVAITGAIHDIDLSEVQPKMKRPAAKRIDSTIIGGRRASSTGFLPFLAKARL